MDQRGESHGKNKALLYLQWCICIFITAFSYYYVTAFGGGNAITFPIDSFSLKWFANVFAIKVIS